MAAMKPSRSASPRWIRFKCASHSPVMAGLLIDGPTVAISAVPRGVARSALPSRLRYWRLSKVSMMSARVAGVPNPRSFIAADSSLSSKVRPADSIAVSKAASVSRGGGRVCLASASAFNTCTAWPAISPGGNCRVESSSASTSVLVADVFLGLERRPLPEAAGAGVALRAVLTSNTFHPTCSTVVPLLW